MRLHTNLTSDQVRDALASAQQAGHITPDVRFAVFGEYRSQTHRRTFEVQLGTDDKMSLPPGTVDQRGKTLRIRRPAKGTRTGDGLRFAATWHEWGWLIAEVFAADPGSRWGADPARSRRGTWGYSSPADFHAKTHREFLPDGEPYEVTGANVAAMAAAHPGWASPAERIAMTEAEHPEWAEPDTSPTTQAMLPVVEQTLAAIDAALDPVVFGPQY